MNKKIFRVDFIRVMAAFFVVLLHTSGLYLGLWKKVKFNVWMTQNLYDSFTRMAVPLFVMLSGALLLNKEETYSDFFKKRISKIIIPFITWIGVYLCWRIFYLNEDLGIKRISKCVVQGPVYYHLWYLYMLIGLYLITPIIWKITKNSNKTDLRYIMGLWIIFTSIIPTATYIARIRFNIDVSVGITVPMMTGYIGYYIMGYYLNRIEHTKSVIIFSWVGLIGSWMTISFGTWYFTDYSKAFNDVFYSYYSPTVALESICGFTLLSYYGDRLDGKISDKAKGIFSKLGNASFGVYLVHPLILDLFLKDDLWFPTRLFTTNPISSIMLVTLQVTAISFFIALILLKLPLLRYTVGGSKKSVNKACVVEKS